MNMAKITNIVVYADLNCSFNLKPLAQTLNNVIYNPSKFNALIWNHRHIKGNCLLFKNGRMICNGTSRWKDARKSLRQYTRILQKLHYTVQLKSIKLITMSAAYTLSTKVNYSTLLTHFSHVTYEPELFHAAMLKKNNINFTVFHTGKVIITGIKEDLNVTVNPTLMEIELLI